MEKGQREDGRAGCVCYIPSLLYSGEPMRNMSKLRKGSKIVLAKEVKILPIVEPEIKMAKSVTVEWD